MTVDDPRMMERFVNLKIKWYIWKPGSRIERGISEPCPYCQMRCITRWDVWTDMLLYEEELKMRIGR
jgi:hypothetical protein